MKKNITTPLVKSAASYVNKLDLKALPAKSTTLDRLADLESYVRSLDSAPNITGEIQEFMGWERKRLNDITDIQS